MAYNKRRAELPPLDQQVAPAVRTIARPSGSGGDGRDNSGGTWQDPKLFGTYNLWVDTTGDLRIKSSAPTSDLDGTVVGTQS